MLVYISVVVGGMVFSGYDNGFHPSLAFSYAMRYLDVYLGFELWICWMDFRI